MAKLGQKFKKYDFNFKEIILDEVACNGLTATAKKYNINRSTVASWQYNLRNRKFGLKRGKRNLKIDWEAKYQILDYVQRNFYEYKKFNSKEKTNLIKHLIKKGTSKKLALEVVGLNRTTFWYHSKYNKMSLRNNEAFEKIKVIFDSNRKQFGYRRIDTELRKNGVFFNHKKILKIMQIYGIQAKYVEKMRRKRKYNIGKVNKYEDLVKRRFNQINEPLTVLYTDVTYLIHNRRKAFQSTIIDAATREIIDYKISYKNDNKLVMANLNDAIAKIKQIKNPSGIIIHSDHGYQYTSNEFKHICETDNLIISQGKAYTCTDNIVIESFHALLKKGTIHNNKYKNLDHYIQDVHEWNQWYNSYKNSNFVLESIQI